MPSKKSARKQREKKNDEVEWHAFTASLEQFKKNGTGSVINDTLLKQFPLFYGTANLGTMCTRFRLKTVQEPLKTCGKSTRSV